jgi:hypothetical protein
MILEATLPWQVHEIVNIKCLMRIGCWCRGSPVPSNFGGSRTRWTADRISRNHRVFSFMTRLAWSHHLSFCAAAAPGDIVTGRLPCPITRPRRRLGSPRGECVRQRRNQVVQLERRAMKSLRAVLYLCIAMFGISACSAHAPDAAPVGTLQMPLVATATSGAQYHLAGTFEVSGPESPTLAADGEASSIQVDLQEGDYSVRLVDGWHLSRIQNGGPTPVDATLESANPQTFMIQRNASIQVTFSFQTQGDVVSFGRGTLVVGIGVDDQKHEANCSDGIDNDADDYVDCQDLDCAVACEQLCQVGSKRCSNETTVQFCNVSGQWVDDVPCSTSCFNCVCRGPLCLPGEIGRCTNPFTVECLRNGNWVKVGFCVDGGCTGAMCP